MARSAGRGASAVGSSWWATLGGALLLIVLGFGVGLVAGAGFEEPGLVIDHLLGRTTELPLAEASSSPPERAADLSSLVSPLGSGAQAPAAVGAAPPTAAPKPASGSYAVQVGAFAKRAPAEGLARELREAGLQTYVSAARSGRARFRVRVGPLASRQEAERVAARLKKDHQLPTWILARDPG